jgi:hypothetical protein
MTLARPRAGRQPAKIHPELGKSGRVAELGAQLAPGRQVKRLRVKGADDPGKRGYIDAFFIENSVGVGSSTSSDEQ